MPEPAVRPLTVVLALSWKHNDIYDAKVSVTVLDSCYEPGKLHEGLPKGKVGIPEMEYLTFPFTHVSGRACSDIVKTIDQTIQIKFSPAKPNATAYAVVNGEVVGQDTKPFPRK
jgi:hypothetical protein